MVNCSNSSDGIHSEHGDVAVTMTGNLDISVSSSSGRGIFTQQAVTLSGGGNVTISAFRGIHSYQDTNITMADNGKLTITAGDIGIRTGGNTILSGKGDVIINARKYGIHTYGLESSVTLSGDGDVIITTDGDNNRGIYAASGSVTLSGKGDVTVKAKVGIFSQGGDVILSGSGDVTVTAGLSAVHLDTTGKKLWLNGTGTLSFTANYNQVIYNAPENSSPVAGSELLNYNVTGAPESKSVQYIHKSAYAILYIAGSGYTKEQLENDQTGAGWSWAAATNTLTLTNYDSSYIKYTETNEQEKNVKIILAAGTNNIVASNVNEPGIYTDGNLTFSGAGSLLVDCSKSSDGIHSEHGDVAVTMTGKLEILVSNGNGIFACKAVTLSGDGEVNITSDTDGIYAGNGAVELSGKGDVSITAGDDGIYAASGSVTLSGDGEVNITSNTDGIYAGNGAVELSGKGVVSITAGDDGIYAASGSVTLSGDGNVTIKASYKKGIYAGNGAVALSGKGVVSITADDNDGIYAVNGDVILSGSGEVTVTAFDRAVCLNTSGTKLKLNGTGTPLTFTSKRGTGDVICNNADHVSSPVAGSNFSDYTTVGGPEDSYVQYNHRSSYPILHIAGLGYTQEQLESNHSGEGWSWAAATNTLTLTNYNSGYIKYTETNEQEKNVKIILEDGTENTVTVLKDVREHGIYANGNLTFSGAGNLSVNCQNNDEGLYFDGIHSEDGDVTVEMAGELKLISGDDGIEAYKTVTLSGTGDVTIAADYGIYAFDGDVNITDTMTGGLTIHAKYDGIYAKDGNVTLSGSGAVSITAGDDGIYVSEGDVVHSGNGKVTVTADEYAVYLVKSDTELKFSGTGTPLTFTAGNGYKAIYREADNASPVNDEFSNYTAVGAPGESSVRYNYISFYAVAVTLTAPSAGKTYDGTALTQTTGVTASGLPAGFTVEATASGSRTDAGSSANVVDDGYVIRDGNGVDLTAYFTDVTKVNGTLTVNPKAVTITTAGASKAYDGTALTEATASIEGIVTGESVTLTATGSRTEVGSSSNTYNITWDNASAANYTVTENLGTLTITENAAAVTLTAPSDSKTYDGTALTADGSGEKKVTASGLPAGFTVEATATGSQTDAGSSANVVDDGYIIKDTNGNDKTANFTNVMKVNGTLTVTPLEHNMTQQPQAWTKGSGTPASFTSNAAFADFKHVTVDGKEVDASNYDVYVKDGATIVTFNAAFLETLSEGEHRVEIVSRSGIAHGMIEIRPSVRMTQQPPAWTKGSGTPASFTSNAAFADFLRVKVDGQVVDASNYDVKEGSTVVTFKPAFLETLSEGKHRVEIVSKSGTAHGMIEITKSGSIIPQTGDTSGYYLWLALTLLSAGGLVLVLQLVVRRKKSKQRD